MSVSLSGTSKIEKRNILSDEKKLEMAKGSFSWTTMGVLAFLKNKGIDFDELIDFLDKAEHGFGSQLSHEENWRTKGKHIDEFKRLIQGTHSWEEIKKVTDKEIVLVGCFYQLPAKKAAIKYMGLTKEDICHKWCQRRSAIHNKRGRKGLETSYREINIPERCEVTFREVVPKSWSETRLPSGGSPP